MSLLASASARLDSTVSTVTKQTARPPALMEGPVFTQENVFALQDLRESSVNSASAPNPAETEVNALVKASVSVRKVTKETCALSLSASLAVVPMEPATNPTNASVERAGMGDTAIKGTEPASCMPRGQQAPGWSGTRLHLKRLRGGGIHLNPITSGELHHLKRFELRRVHSLC